MKNLIIAAIALAAFTFATKNVRADGDHAGNGGGVVQHDGVYMSFYTAGLYVEPTEGEPVDSRLVSPIKSVTNYITNLPSLGYQAKGAILSAVNPSATRHYYIASPKDFTLQERARILKEYESVTHVDVSNLQLAAITDIPKGNTFILPPFFKLSQSDQMAILFHEAYWTMHPSDTYNQVVDAEMAFEAALESPNDFARVYDFVSRVGTRSDIYQAAVKWDFNSGALAGIWKYDVNGDPTSTTNGAYIPIKTLLGTSTLTCMEQNAIYNSETADQTAPMIEHPYIAWVCFPFLRANVNQLIFQYPRSALLKMFAQWLDKDQSTSDSSLEFFSGNSYNEVRIPALTEPVPAQDSQLDIANCEWFVSTKIPSLVRCPHNGRYGDESLYSGSPMIWGPYLNFYEWISNPLYY